MTNKIKEIRKKLNYFLDDLERKVKSEGNQIYKQDAVKKQEENRECQALLNAVRNSHVTLETIMKYGSDTQIFIISDRMISQVKLYYEQIKETFEELGTVTLNLEVDPQIQCVLAQNYDIGRVICKNERVCFPISRVEKPLKECHIEQGDAVKIQMSDDKSPYYTGIIYLQGDQVLLSDFHNMRVILLNSSYQCITSFTLPGKPCDICVVDDQEVAVSLPFQKTLQFLTITTGTFKPTRKVKTRYECLGLAPAGNANVVLFGNCSDKGKHYWSLINSTGKVEKCHRFHSMCGPSNTRVALSLSCTRVYMTLYGANSMFCFDTDGRIMYFYSPDSPKGPKGLATDRVDNVYVVGCLSNNIHQLTPDDTPIIIITEGIQESSTAICFNSSLDRFLTTNKTSPDTINIYLLRLK